MRKLFLLLTVVLLISLSASQTDGTVVEIEDSAAYHSLEESPVVSSGDEMTLSHIEKKGVGRFKAQHSESKGLIEYHFAYYSNNSSWILRIGKAPHTTSELGTIDFTDSSSDYIEYTNKDAVNLSEERMLISHHSIVTFDQDESRYNGANIISDSGELNTDGLINASNRKYDLYVNSGGEFERTYIRWVGSYTEEISETQVEPISRDELVQKLESKNERIEELESQISKLKNQIETLESEKQESEASQEDKGFLRSLLPLF